jgi:predicted esterase
VGGEGSAVPAVFVGYAGAYNIMELVKGQDPELAAVLTPDTYIGANLEVQIRLIQGTDDELIPPRLVEQHEALAATLSDAGYDATWTTVVAGHFLTPEAHAAIQSAIEEFLN